MLFVVTERATSGEIAGGGLNAISLRAPVKAS
jgi:hypothetical protein